MPRALKTDKFFVYATAKKGHGRGKRLMGANHTHPEGGNNLTVQDLLDFLAIHRIPASDVQLPKGFITYAKGN
jgi:hypothetical protein